MYGGLTTSALVYSAIFGAAFGNLVPGLYVDRALKKRQTLLRRAFPDALDLLVVCVEAGLGLKSAIARVADELGVSHPELAAEFSLLTAELRAGMDTGSALDNLAKRNGLDDIRGFAALLSQSMRFGTSVSDTLRVYASEFRERRMQKAEEQAGKLSVKMIFPMVVCIFPSFFVVAIGPAVMSMVSAFGG
jgi:tight adherence protein C